MSVNLKSLVAAALSQTIDPFEVKRYDLDERVLAAYFALHPRFWLDEDVWQSILVSTAYKLAPHYDLARLETFGALASRVVRQQAVNHFRAESRHLLLQQEVQNLNASSAADAPPFEHRRPSVLSCTIYLADRARQLETGPEDPLVREEYWRQARGAYEVARIAVYQALKELSGRPREIALLSGFGWVPTNTRLAQLWAEDPLVFNRYIVPAKRVSQPEVIRGNELACVLGVSPSVVSRSKSALQKTLRGAVERSVIRWSVRFRQAAGGRFRS